ncbi:MAG: YcxB family protein [Lachnospiraceae bacterium]|nr:YcxB family protein [Lachnospiraceae bacterium]
MEYKFRCDVKSSDLWKISMCATYHSFAGVMNLIFTVSALAAAFGLWERAGTLLRGVLLFACILFPVIQPLAIYGRSIRQLEDVRKNVELLVDDDGVCVTSGGEREMLPWRRIRNAIKRREVIILMSDETHGYMLFNRNLGKQKEEFFDYLCNKLQNRDRMET